MTDRSECSLEDFKLCIHSYFARRRHANQYCANYSDETELVTGYCYEYLLDSQNGVKARPPPKPHFRVPINFDKDGKEGIYLWLKQYYVYENMLSIVFLDINVILDLFDGIHNLEKKKKKKKKKTRFWKELSFIFCCFINMRHHCSHFTFVEEQVRWMAL